MTVVLNESAHEREVASRFNALHSRFKREVKSEDFRLRALLASLGPCAGRRVLDLGCGKGRFAERLGARGAKVVGLDVSAAMLASARGFQRVLGSARRLPFAGGAFDAVVAVEIFEHLSATSLGAVLNEVRRVLRPGGVVAVVDKNAGSWNARRPWLPNLFLKRLDERRGRWMYPADGPVRERWFWPRSFLGILESSFVDARVEFLTAPDEEGQALFRCVPATRLMALWTAHAPWGEHS